MHSKIFNLKNLKWFTLFVFIIIFLLITKNILNDEIIQSDITFYHLIAKYLISDSLTPFMILVTKLGSATWLIIINALIVIVTKNKKIRVTVTSNLIIIAILNVLLKNILARPRPVANSLIYENGYSFPSGHSMISMAFYGLLIYLINYYIKDKKLRIILITILSLIILLIGISRIYLGIHYFSDVLGGFLLSIAYLILYTSVISRYLKK